MTRIPAGQRRRSSSPVNLGDLGAVADLAVGGDRRRRNAVGTWAMAWSGRRCGLRRDCAGVARPQADRQQLAGVVATDADRVETEAALERRPGPLLVRVCGDQRGVDILDSMGYALARTNDAFDPARWSGPANH